MATPLPLISVRSSSGLQMHCCSPKEHVPHESFQKDSSKGCRVSAFSQDGRFFAWCNSYMVTIISVPSCTVIQQLPKPKTQYLMFSPEGSILVTWEQYIPNKENPSLSNNLFLWDIETGECIKSFSQKKQAGWAPQWTDDEFLCSRNVNNEVHFYENKKFDAIAKKIYIQKVLDFSLSSGPAPFHVGCYVPGSSGQPSFVRLYQYPKFEGNSAVIASKSFFRADRVNMLWNKKGTGMLIMTITDVDKTGGSYYGEQKLHYLTTRGENSVVQLGKDGPVYCVEWNPNSMEFCVVYGFMPAKATVYNLKCEPTFDFGTGPRNLVFYNTFGSMLVLAGFGNLQGNVEVWDTKRRKQIVQFKALDSTHLEWAPNGEHFLTATTSPRLRVGNGYKLWHYSGQLVVDQPWDKAQELYEVQWQPHPEGTYRVSDPVHSHRPAQQETAESVEKVGVYRPPGARGQPASFKLHEENELPSNMKQQEALSKAALKNKKKRDAKKAKQGKGMSADEEEPAASPLVDAEDAATGDVDRDKKIRNLKKKIEQINKLKDQQKAGKPLELNQLEKIKKESELLGELQALQIGADA